MPSGTANGQDHEVDISTLEGLVQSYFARGVTQSTMRTYMSAQKPYLTFCSLYHIPPLPLSKVSTCLFAAFLAHQSLKSQCISSYLSALHYLQVSVGHNAPQRANWPRLQYLLKGIAHSQPGGRRRRFPVTATVAEICADPSEGSFRREWVVKFFHAPKVCLGQPS